MQRDTFTPRILVDNDTGARWWLRRDPDGPRYYRSQTDTGRRPSFFYSHCGQLLSRYRSG